VLKNPHTKLLETEDQSETPAKTKFRLRDFQQEFEFDAHRQKTFQGRA
jgi:hypothetical protein